MAFATVTLKNPITGQMRMAPVGFSWTTLLFGPIPAAMRGHWAMAAGILLAGMATAFLSNIIFAFIYNRMYLQHLIMDNFKIVSATGDLGFIASKVGFDLKHAMADQN